MYKYLFEFFWNGVSCQTKVSKQILIVEAVDFTISDTFLYHCVLLHGLGQSSVWSEVNGAPEYGKQHQQHTSIKAITF